MISSASFNVFEVSKCRAFLRRAFVIQGAYGYAVQGIRGSCLYKFLNRNGFLRNPDLTRIQIDFKSDSIIFKQGQMVRQMVRQMVQQIIG